MRMSLTSRKEYLSKMRARYSKAISRATKTTIINEIVEVLGYHRKYAIQVLSVKKQPNSHARKRRRSSKYGVVKSVVMKVWQALDYPCAERLHPVLLSTAELLAQHGEIHIDATIRQLLATISRSTLARMLVKSRAARAPRMSPPRKRTQLERQVPIERYASGEMRPGALEIDLVEHNGGSSLGHYAYTLSVVDVATGYSRRRSVLGKGQAAVHRELESIFSSWPYSIWGVHTDNGTEFLNSHLIRFCQAKGFKYTRSRPYKKNDNPHVEQKNFQHVRCLVGYERYDTPEEVAWLNRIYEVYDLYVNLYQPSRKLVSKERMGSRVRKVYDVARTPLQRAFDARVVSPESVEQYKKLYHSLNPLAIHRQIEKLLSCCPTHGEKEESKQEVNAAAN